MLRTIVLFARLFDSSPAFQAVVADNASAGPLPVLVDDLAGNTHVLSGGRRERLVSSDGQVRLFGADGSITVFETDGRTWKL